MQNISLDKIRGGLIGVVIGDVLGAPHEFRVSNPISEYTGLIHLPAKVPSRFQGTRIIPEAQYTDDTEMTLVMLRSIVANKGYNLKDVVINYSFWATSGGIGIGTNTAELLKKSKAKNPDNRYNMYVKQYSKKFNCPPGNTAQLSINCVNTGSGKDAQSNGSLMRSFPLALFNINDPLVVDCCLTNPSWTNLFVEYVHIDIIRLNIQGYSKEQVYQIILLRYDGIDNMKEIMNIFKTAVSEAINTVSRNVKDKKGWVLHAFYLSIKAYFHLILTRMV